MQIGWIDFSSKERNKIVSILKILGDQSALDELGIGSIRDVFSDALFPGTSVLQTRAKYFVLIPYLFSDLEKQRFRDRREVKNSLHNKEDQLIKILSKNTPDAEGIIGIRKGTAKMKPSSIYWNGLRVLGILRNPTYSLDTALGYSFNKSKRRFELTIKEEDNDSAADDADVIRDGNLLFMPIAPDYDFMKETSMDLTKKEAEYLKYHFSESINVKNSLMAYMLKNPEMFFDMTGNIPIPLFNSVLSINENILPTEIAYSLKLAKQFSVFIYGAHLLYNIIYADGCQYEDDTVIRIKEEFERWLESYESPDLEDIIEFTSPKETTRLFLRKWDEVCSNRDITAAKHLIIAREKQVKPGRSKLNHPDHYRYSVPIHYFHIAYRYDRSMVLLTDILSGLISNTEEEK